MTADQIIQNAGKVLARLEEQKRKGGKYAWRIKNKHFRNRAKEPASHVIYSDAETEKEAIADFQRRTGAQFDTSMRSNPWEAVRDDLPDPSLV